MTREKIMEGLTLIFRDVFDDEKILITDNTTAKDIEDWDSLAHLQLIAQTEKQFNLHFSMAEVVNFANVGNLCDSILKHLG